MNRDHESRAALFDFVEQWIEDRGRGESPPLMEYLRRFPDHQEDVAREFLRLWEEENGAAVLPPSPAQGTLCSSSIYTVGIELARGGMGLVQRVRDESLQRELAMKVVLRGGAGAVARFEKEARITGQLEHPGVVPVHALGIEADGRSFFTMRLVGGRDLSEIVQLVHRGEEGWTLARALGVLLRVCETVAYAHSRGVVHRDLKSSNVRVGGFGEVYVMDWGLAHASGEPELNDLRLRPPGNAAARPESSGPEDQRATPSASPLVTMDGDVIGTPCTMAPEQAAGRIEELGPRSDVYSVGAMLYELLAGAMPYLAPGERVTPRQVLERVLAGPPAPLYELSPSAPAELISICEKAMARDPADRYADMQEMAGDLRAWLERRVVGAHRPVLLAGLRKWIARNRALSGSIAAGLLVLAAGLTASAVFRGRSERNWRRAESNLNLAEKRASEVEERRVEAESYRSEAMLLSALQDLDDLVAEADDPETMWPAHPDRIPRYQAWISRARALVAGLPEFRARREEVRAGALPRTEEERLRQRANHPGAPVLQRLEGRIEAMRRSLARRRDGVEAELPDLHGDEYPGEPQTLNWLARQLVDLEREEFGNEPLGLALALRARELAGEDPALQTAITDTIAAAFFALGRDDEALRASSEVLDEMPAEIDAELRETVEMLRSAVSAASSEEGVLRSAAELAQLEAERDALELELAEYREWSFPEDQPAARWWNNQLTKLIEGLEALSSAKTGLLAEDATSLERGWSVPRRLALAEEMQRDFAPGGRYAQRWNDALPEIRSAYPGLSISVQMGLVPIGPDPESGLWEFWLVQSGAEPVRDSEGRLTLGEEDGLVLVLLRGGTFCMGAQKRDPTIPNYDPPTTWSLWGIRNVELSPCFLSKYELTQAQWMHLTGTNPSRMHPGGEALGATLRNPVDTVSWFESRRVLGWLGLTLPTQAQWEYACRAGTGTPFSWPAEADPGEYANLSDQTCARELIYSGGAEAWDDGYACSSPVGSFLPNAFGLHDMHGNVREWCLDGNTWFLLQRGVLRISELARDPLHEVPSSQVRANRGGGCLSTAEHARSSLCMGAMPSGANEETGVRPGRALTR